VIQQSCIGLKMPGKISRIKIEVAKQDYFKNLSSPEEDTKTNRPKVHILQKTSKIEG